MRFDHPLYFLFTGDPHSIIATYSGMEKWPSRWAHIPKIARSNRAPATNFYGKRQSYEQSEFWRELIRFPRSTLTLGKFFLTGSSPRCYSNTANGAYSGQPEMVSKKNDDGDEAGINPSTIQMEV